MDLTTIKQQIVDANVTDLFGTKKEVKALPDIMEDDEVIQYGTSGLVDGNTILAVLTQKRILFIDKGLIYGIKSTEIPLDMVNGVSYSKGMLLGKIAVVNGAKTTTIENVGKNTCSIMADKIKQASELYKQSLRQTSQSQPVVIKNADDDVAQIRKFKSLLDDGILTQAEFDAKKKKILGI